MNVRPTNRVRAYRVQRGWSQAELAAKAGISRTAVTAIEGSRLVPSVTAALALARAFGCTVEELFDAAPPEVCTPDWAWPPPRPQWRYWQAEVSGRPLLYPVESAAASSDWPHDGVGRPDALPDVDATLARRTLVLACCDPAAGLLASTYGRSTGFRMLVIPRASQRSLDLLARGLVHVAGLHLSSGSQDLNAQAVQSKLGAGFKLMRMATWQEGLAVTPTQSGRTVRSVVQSRLRWIGREPGSGARQCMDELLPRKVTTRHVASDHRGVAQAIRSGWADAGVCLRLACEEAGLRFLSLRDEYFELCYPAQAESDPRIQALVRVVRSAEYQRLLADLPGYGIAQTGEIRSAE